MRRLLSTWEIFALFFMYICNKPYRLWFISEFFNLYWASKNVFHFMLSTSHLVCAMPFVYLWRHGCYLLLTWNSSNVFSLIVHSYIQMMPNVPEFLAVPFCRVHSGLQHLSCSSLHWLWNNNVVSYIVQPHLGAVTNIECIILRVMFATIQYQETVLHFKSWFYFADGVKKYEIFFKEYRKWAIKRN